MIIGLHHLPPTTYHHHHHPPTRNSNISLRAIQGIINQYKQTHLDLPISTLATKLELACKIQPAYQTQLDLEAKPLYNQG